MFSSHYKNVWHKERGFVKSQRRENTQNKANTFSGVEQCSQHNIFIRLVKDYLWSDNGQSGDVDSFFFVERRKCKNL